MGRPESFLDSSNLSGGIRTEMGGSTVKDGHRLSGEGDMEHNVLSKGRRAFSAVVRAFKQITSLPARLEEDVIRGTLTDD